MCSGCGVRRGHPHRDQPLSPHARARLGWERAAPRAVSRIEDLDLWVFGHARQSQRPVISNADFVHTTHPLRPAARVATAAARADLPATSGECCRERLRRARRRRPPACTRNMHARRRAGRAHPHGCSRTHSLMRGPRFRGRWAGHGRGLRLLRGAAPPRSSRPPLRRMRCRPCCLWAARRPGPGHSGGANCHDAPPQGLAAGLASPASLFASPWRRAELR